MQNTHRQSAQPPTLHHTPISHTHTLLFDCSVSAESPSSRQVGNAHQTPPLTSEPKSKVCHRSHHRLSQDALFEHLAITNTQNDAHSAWRSSTTRGWSPRVTDHSQMQATAGNQQGSRLTHNISSFRARKPSLGRGKPETNRNFTHCLTKLHHRGSRVHTHSRTHTHAHTTAPSMTGVMYPECDAHTLTNTQTHKHTRTFPSP